MRIKCPVCSGENLSPETMVSGVATGVLGYMYFKVNGKKADACIRTCRVCKDCGYVLAFVKDKNCEWEKIKENWDNIESMGY